MRKNIGIVSSVAALAVIGLSLSASGSVAQAPPKNISREACQANPEYRWVEAGRYHRCLRKVGKALRDAKKAVADKLPKKQ